MIYLAIIFICSLFFAVFLSLMIMMDGKNRRYGNYIINSTRFFCKKSPGITCQVLAIYDDFINPRILIKVNYPSGNTCTVLTTIGAFDNIWLEYQK